MGGISVAVEIGSGVKVDGIGDDVFVGEAGEATTEAHPLIDTAINTKARIIDATEIFILLSLLILFCKTAPNGWFQRQRRGWQDAFA